MFYEKKFMITVKVIIDEAVNYGRHFSHHFLTGSQPHDAVVRAVVVTLQVQIKFKRDIGTPIS
jgi:hypothetical protein